MAVPMTNNMTVINEIPKDCTDPVASPEGFCACFEKESIDGCNKYSPVILRKKICASMESLISYEKSISLNLACRQGCKDEDDPQPQCPQDCVTQTNKYENECTGNL